VLTVDTSGLIALIDTRDDSHQACRAVFDDDGGPYFLSIAILSELAWLLETRFHPEVEQTVLDDIQRGAYALDWGSGDLERIQSLTRRYHDLGLGLADSAVVACGERHGGRILTTDHRHFPVVARGEGTITVLPA
jgi:predicted nucleic acid-binding protein